MDIGVHLPMQEFYNQATQLFTALIPTANIRKADFLQIFMRIHRQALTVVDIEHAFEATGNHHVNYRKARTSSYNIPR